MENALDIDEFEGLFYQPAVINGEWREDDEERLEGNEDLWKAYRTLEDLSEDELFERYADETAACRIVFPMYGRLPHQIVSSRYRFRAAEFSPQVWQLFVKIAVQPFFAAERSSLVAAIQYAVICRT